MHGLDSKALLNRFAAENNLDIGILEGTKSFAVGPNNHDRTDPYHFDLGGRWPTPEPGSCSDFSATTSITALRITYGKRFANSVMQLSNAIQMAGSLGVSRIHLPNLWYVKPGSHLIDGEIELINNEQPDLSRDQLVLSGNYFRTVALKPLLRQRLRHRRLLRDVRNLLTLDIDSQGYGNNDLVIYIRSGDVFSGSSPHPSYGQPPFAFYRKVVLFRKRKWQTVRVVFQDLGNPVIEPLLQWLPDHCRQMIPVSGELRDDLSVLLNARNLISGKGTFCSAVSALSRHLRTVYCFDREFKSWGNKKVKALSFADRAENYIRQIYAGNWRNSPEQRRLMVNYPDHAIHVRGRT
ncbi:hypothetical protein [Cyanobium sp. CH-040]|uniref:hypothetical protein n=1 Tax=Cyanobium sp. CH-040 TaxID=2823708 RepID=UPI0020CD45B5|nr:hypothetical protein [Cyanobium sp. CH-040]MCP9926409.1 hypothetical protein [Cyanobium sp. CH-040]